MLEWGEIYENKWKIRWKEIIESAFLHGKEFAATGNSEADIISASSKGLEKVGKDVCSTIPVSDCGC